LLLGNAGNQILAFLFGVVLARLLTPDVFGILVAIQIYTGFLGLVAGGGMGQALVQAREVSRQDYDAVFSVQLVIGIAIYLGFYFVAPYFAIWYENVLYQDLLRVAALSFLLRPFVNLSSNILRRDMRFKALAGVNMLTLTLSSATSITLAWLGYGVWSLIIGGLIASFAGIAILLPLAGWRPALTLSWVRARNLARYGFLVSVGDVIVYIRSQVPNLVLSRTLGVHALGIFNKAYSLARTPNLQITGSLYQVTFRALAQEQDNLDLSRYLYLRSITLVGVYTWPAFVVMAWLALPTVRLLYGENWVEAAGPLRWFALAGPLAMVEMLGGCVLAARGWLGREIPVQVAQTVILTLGVLGGLSFGLIGVAIGAGLASVYGALHLTWLSARCLSMPLRSTLVALLTPMLFALAMAFVWLLMDHAWPSNGRSELLYIATRLAVSGIVFVCLFFLVPIRCLESERVRWLVTMKRLVLPRLVREKA
jgi:O-antigen/teichoic acid export membrane protein